MGDFSSVLHLCEGDQHVIAATQHLVKALGSSKILNDDLRKILSQLDSHLSSMNILTTESRGPGFREVEEQFRCSEEKIMGWESRQSFIWDCGPLEASQYLKSVHDIQTLIEGFRSSSANEDRKHKELVNRAESLLQIAMSKLEEELIHILVKHKQYFEPEYMSFRSWRMDVVYDESFVSVEDIAFEEESQRNFCGSESEEYILDLVDPHVIPHLKSIADIMFASNYRQEFCQAFISARRDALEEYLIILKVEKLSIEDVLKMQWDSLSSKIKNWVRAMKIIIRYLASEKRLCDQISGDFGFVSPLCFADISKVSLLPLLSFGEAIAMETHGPEKLFCLLDMYEVVADNLLYIDTLFSEEAGAWVRIEFHELHRGLADTARATFMAFGNAIAANGSTSPFPKGAIHPLTKYVMNHISTLTIYRNALNVLLKDHDTADSNLPENGHGSSSLTYGHLACCLRSITSTLEFNLDCKSKLYKDAALQHIFLMNNFHYMVEKVKGSELRLFFGDDWIRKHIVKFQQHATSYQRATWSSVLSLLRDDGSASKAILNEKCRGFCIVFEEVYKSQTGWSIPDFQLREELQISTSQKVVHAYRNFTGRNSSSIGDKYIKYTADDLQNYILDFFDGSPRSLQNSRWKEPAWF